MSLDVTLYGESYMKECECPHCDNKHQTKTRDELYWRNITHNLSKMADAAGLYEALWRPEEIGAKKAKDIIGKVALGLDILKANPEEFKKYNASNGWGKYENLVEFVESYLNALQEYPYADISISR